MNIGQNNTQTRKVVTSTELGITDGLCVVLTDQVMCKLPASVKRGSRCVNGCYGEGIMIYACNAHWDYFRTLDETTVKCSQCDVADALRYFPVQDIT